MDHRIQNNITTIYILEIGSSIVKSVNYVLNIKLVKCDLFLPRFVQKLLKRQ
jgi:hypothetical protein